MNLTIEEELFQALLERSAFITASLFSDIELHARYFMYLEELF